MLLYFCLLPTGKWNDQTAIQESAEDCSSIAFEWTLPKMQRYSEVGVGQRVIKHLPPWRLWKSKAGHIRCFMKMFTGLISSPFLSRSLPMRFCRRTQALWRRKCYCIVDAGKLLKLLDGAHKKKGAKDEQFRTRAQHVRNAKTNALPLYITNYEFALAKMNANRTHKLQTYWNRSMDLTKTMSQLPLCSWWHEPLW